jgi:cation transport ATPase
MIVRMTERSIRQGLITVALTGLALGLAGWLGGKPALAFVLWAAGTLPVVIALLVSMVRDLLAGRMGVDAIAFVSMSTALLLGEGLAAAVVAVMYAGGNVLEDYAVARAERDLKSLIDRAPRIAHRRVGGTVEDVPIDQVAVGDTILVRAGEVIPVDGIISMPNVMIDELALTGEPIPVNRREGDGSLITEVNAIVAKQIVAHEREDEDAVYPRLSKFLSDGHGLAAMSRAHREIIHQARLLGRIAIDLAPSDADRYLIRDAQRVIESIEALVRIHNAQEEDIYEHAAAHEADPERSHALFFPGATAPAVAFAFGAPGRHSHQRRDACQNIRALASVCGRCAAGIFRKAL